MDRRETTDRAKLGGEVIEACLSLGFALAGIAPAEPTAWREQFLDWLSAGKHGEMQYMTEMLEERLDVRRLLPGGGARAVIVVADQYAASGSVEGPQDRQRDGAEPTGVVAKYARGQDYHAVIRRRLHLLCDRLRAAHAGAEFRAFVDTAPAIEREHAVRAGLGGAFVGKHTLLIHPRIGSYLLLGGVVTTLDIQNPRGDAGARADAGSPGAHSPPSPGVTAGVLNAHCGTCTACIDACPTQAITPYQVDATRCISYLTLEHRSVIDPALHAGVGDHLIGCDICQDVCPFNRVHEEGHGRARVHPAYADPGGRTRLPILEILGWSEEDRSRVLSGSAAKRASLAMIRRNALVIAGNALAGRDDAALRSRLTGISTNAAEDPLVQSTARQVLDRITPARTHTDPA